MPNVRRRMLIAFVVVSGLYVLVAGIAYAVQGSILYPVPQGAEEPDAPGATLLRIPRPSGRTAIALHFPAPQGSPTVVHFHGNGEQLADAVNLAHMLQSRGLGVLAVEYPGYGLARGEAPSETGICEAAHAAITYLQHTLGVPRERTVLLGQSLGTGVATQMAAEGLAARMILVSPYTSITAMAGRIAPFLPIGLLLRDRFDTLRKAREVSVPVLIIHGTADEVVPFGMGEQLSHVFPHATFDPIVGAHHNDIYAVGGAQLLNSMTLFALGIAAP